MIQVNSSWSFIGSVREMEKELKDFIFKGPGIYQRGADVLLIVPIGVINWTLMNADYYNIHIYNCPLQSTILQYCKDIPIREIV